MEGWLSMIELTAKWMDGWLDELLDGVVMEESVNRWIDGWRVE